MKPTLHLLLALLLAPLAALNAAEFRLPSIFSDHMVLQSATAVPVWGWADAGEQIVVEFAGQTKSTTANADGKWTVKLDALESSAGAREMVVQSPGRKRSVKVADVIVGEVWAGGGQSNMEFDMKAITSAGEEIEASANPTLRQFHVLKNPSSRTPADDVQGFWTVARPGTTEDFIAAGYYFAKSIQRELKTPVGLIKVCWGGSKVEPWISPESLASVPEMAAGAKNMDALSERNKSAFREWLKQTKREDRPAGDVAPFTCGPASKDHGWVAVKDSGPVTDPSLPKFGAFWFRKEVDLTARQTGAAQVLQFGPSAQFDQVYWNGTLIGGRDVDSFTGLTSVRHYLIPPTVLKEGVNQLAVRIFAPAEPPGFSWFPSVGSTKMPGGWMAKAEYELPPLEPAAKAAVPPLTGQHVLAGRLFQGMVRPILPYAIRGVLWYQGESNTGNANLYRTAFPLLIQDWRKHWEQGDFPFYYCQLANYRPKTDQPGESIWADLREAQAMTLSVPNTGMAVLIDTGESEDIHPQSKQVAGERLARIALAKTYGRDVVHSGPVYGSMQVEGSAVRLSFDHLGGGLVAKRVPATYDVMRKAGKTAPLVRNSPHSQLEGFAICGADRKWVWADAKIDGDTVLVSSVHVSAPVAVRYGWSDNPTCNLFNASELPASPFRTDDFSTAAVANSQPPVKPSPAAAKDSKPNILLILADDMGWGDLRCHGNAKLSTPSLDRLKTQSVAFEHFHVSPICSPTRSSLLTGRHHARLHVINTSDSLEVMHGDETTLAEALKPAGYVSGCFGKWHNGSNHPSTAQGQGFDEFFGFSGGFFPNYFDAQLEHNGVNTPTKGFITDVLADAAMSFIEQNKARPFFCYVPFNACHSPMQAPQDLFEKYRTLGFEPKDAAVYAMVENLDRNVGRILQKLDQTGLAANTIVLFTTDNGPNTARYNGGMRGGKGSVFEGGLRVPCFIRWPEKLKAGSRVPEITQHVDILPTLLELAAVPLPKRQPLDGLSLVPLLKGNPSSWPQRTLFDLTGRGGKDGTVINEYPGTARTETHRWVHDGKQAMLFDLRNDPSEKTNLATQQPALAAEMEMSYRKWFHEVTAPSGGKVARFPITLTEGTELPIANAARIGGAQLFGKGWDYDWATFPTPTAAMAWRLSVPVAGLYEVGALHTAKTTGGEVRVTVGDTAAHSVITAVYDPPEIPRRDLIPRWEVPDKVFKPLGIGTITLPAGSHDLQVTAAPGIEIQAVRLKRLH
jgi:sialate O-acetylesterase